MSLLETSPIPLKPAEDALPKETLPRPREYPARGKSRLVYLDGLRGLAVLMVVVYHIWGNAGRLPWWIHVGPVSLDLTYPIEALGGSRVSLFFVLSGFLLYLPFARASASSASSESKTRWDTMPMTTWLWRRFRRIGPPYWAAILLSLLQMALLFVLSGPWRSLNGQPTRAFLEGNFATALPASLVFMHGMVPGSAKPVFNEPLWTMTPEVELYLAFPLLLLIARKKGLQAAVGVAVAASILARLWLFAHREFLLALPGGPSVSIYAFGVNTFVGRWAEFALGMGAAGLAATGRLPAPRLLLPLCAGTLALFFVLRGQDAALPACVPWLDVLGGVGYALLVLACAATPRLARCFCWRPLTKLGVLSFSLYLTHWSVMRIVGRFLEAVFHHNHSNRFFVLDLGLGLPLMLLVARWFWQTFERPFLSPEARKVVP